MPPRLGMVFNKSFQSKNATPVPLPTPIQPQQLFNSGATGSRTSVKSMNILSADAQKKGCRSCGGK